MKTTKTFTSTISPNIIAWLDTQARARKTTRRAILEEAVERYKKDIDRKTMSEGFLRAAEDPDMLELAEWGMDDYQTLIK